MRRKMKRSCQEKNSKGSNGHHRQIKCFLICPSPFWFDQSGIDNFSYQSIVLLAGAISNCYPSERSKYKKHQSGSSFLLDNHSNRKRSYMFLFYSPFLNGQYLWRISVKVACKQLQGTVRLLLEEMGETFPC